MLGIASYMEGMSSGLLVEEWNWKFGEDMATPLVAKEASTAGSLTHG